MSKKSRPISYSGLLYKTGQDICDIQYVHKTTLNLNKPSGYEEDGKTDYLCGGTLITARYSYGFNECASNAD